MDFYYMKRLIRLLTKIILYIRVFVFYTHKLVHRPKCAAYLTFNFVIGLYLTIIFMVIPLLRTSVVYSCYVRFLG